MMMNHQGRRWPIQGDKANWLARNVCPHEPALRRWLAGRFQHGVLIDDVIQETYARLVTLSSVDHITNPRAYFFRAALSVVITEVQRAPVVSFESLAEIERLNIEANELAPDVQAEYKEELRLVTEAILQLPPKCREVFVLRKVQGLSQRETAEKLGLSESTVEKHVGRGTRHLVNIFGRGSKSPPVTSQGPTIVARHGPDSESYEKQGKQCRDRATGSPLGGPA